MRGWLTPNALPTEFVCRVLRIPDDPTWIAPVTGAILSLTEEFNWEKFGVTTPEEAAEIYGAMLNDYLDQGFSNCMIGVIFPFMTTDPPNGGLECDGRTLNRTDYPLLYERTDSAFVLDADTFFLPDLRSRDIIGAGEGTGLSSYVVGQTGGEENHALTATENAAHTHVDAGHIHSEVAASPITIPPGEIPIPLPSASPLPTSTGIGYADIQSSGDGTPHNNLQPYIALRWAVWYR